MGFARPPVYRNQATGDVITLASRCSAQFVVVFTSAASVPCTHVPRLDFVTFFWIEIFGAHFVVYGGVSLTDEARPLPMVIALNSLASAPVEMQPRQVSHARGQNYSAGKAQVAECDPRGSLRGGLRHAF